ncbi:MAG: hypothetical protein AAFY84_15555 [Pseudomonadota bacterium]
MARHPKDVSAAVFSGAGPIFLPDWREVSDGKLDEAMSSEEKAAFDRDVFRPRLLVAIALSEINPQAAVRFLSQREAGSFFDEIANRHYMTYTVCDADNVKTGTERYGFWSNRMTGKSLDSRTDDPKPILAKNSTPVLVIRGACDYKAEAVAKQYASVFPNARYVSTKVLATCSIGRSRRSS